MKIAVSVDEEGLIIPHLGKASWFKIYSKTGDSIEFIEEIETSGNHTNHIIDEINDCDVVISGQIGEGMIENLKSLGIKAIAITDTDDPIGAIERL